MPVVTCAAGSLVGEHAGHDFHRIRLLPLGGETRLPGPPAIQLALDILLFKRNPWRAAIDDTADSGPVAFAEARKPEKMAESIERHGSSALVRFGNVRSGAGQLNGECTWICAISALFSFSIRVAATCAELTFTSLNES